MLELASFLKTHGEGVGCHWYSLAGPTVIGYLLIPSPRVITGSGGTGARPARDDQVASIQMNLLSTEKHRFARLHLCKGRDAG